MILLAGPMPDRIRPAAPATTAILALVGLAAHIGLPASPMAQEVSVDSESCVQIDAPIAWRADLGEASAAKQDTGGGPYSIELWLRTNQAESGVELVTASLDPSLGVWVGLHRGHPIVAFAGQRPQMAEAMLADARWHHLGLVVQGAHARLQMYVDGDPIRSVDAARISIPSDTPRLRVGGSGERRFVGTIDGLTVYGRELLRTELVSIWAAGVGGKCPL